MQNMYLLKNLKDITCLPLPHHLRAWQNMLLNLILLLVLH